MTIRDGWLTWAEIQLTVWPDASKSKIVRYMNRANEGFVRFRDVAGDGRPRGPAPRELHYSALPELQRCTYEQKFTDFSPPDGGLEKTFANATEIRLDMRRPSDKRLIVRVPALSRHI